MLKAFAVASGAISILSVASMLFRHNEASDKTMPTPADEYREASAFCRDGYRMMYEIAKIFLIVNAAFFAIINYGSTHTVIAGAPSDAIAATLRSWALNFVPVLGVYAGPIAVMAHMRLMAYLKVFATRGERIENSLKNRTSKEPILLFAETIKSTTRPLSLPIPPMITYISVAMAYACSSLAWLGFILYLIFNNIITWSCYVYFILISPIIAYFIILISPIIASYFFGAVATIWSRRMKA